MALVYSEGFDVYNGIGANVGLAAGGNIELSYGTVALDTGAYGGQALKATCTIDGFASVTANFGRGIGGDASIVALGGNFMYDGQGTHRSAGLMYRLYRLGVCQVAIGLSPTNGIVVYRNSLSGYVQIANSPGGLIKPHVWYFIDVICSISGSSGVLGIFIDGVPTFGTGGLNTLYQGNIDEVRFGTGIDSSGNYYHDDVYVDNVGTAVGPSRSQILYPNADGTTLNWVASTGTLRYAMVNDVVADTSTYISASSVGQAVELGLTNVAATTDQIHSVVVRGFANKTDGTARSIALGIKSGTTISTPSSSSLTTSPVVYDNIYLTNPDTSSAWDSTTVNNLLLRPIVTL